MRAIQKFEIHISGTKIATKEHDFRYFQKNFDKIRKNTAKYCTTLYIFVIIVSVSHL